MNTSPNKYRIFYEIHKHCTYCHSYLIDSYTQGDHSIPQEITSPLLNLFKRLPKFSQVSKFQHFLKMFVYYYPTVDELYADVLTTGNYVAFSKKSYKLAKQISDWVQGSKCDSLDSSSE